MFELNLEQLRNDIIVSQYNEFMNQTLMLIFTK